MKVKRQNITEEYSTTVGWLNDFANSIEKNADFLSNLKSVFKHRNEPKTIDEKMADIRSRVGYDLIKGVGKDLKNLKEAACGPTCCNKAAGGEDCGSCGTGAEPSGNEDALRLIDQILVYIRAIAKDRPELSPAAILRNCRLAPGLDWNIVESRIDPDKIIKFIEREVAKHSGAPESVMYTPTSGLDLNESPTDTVPEFMDHNGAH
jgi:hypothetical protein